jgi:hypothetical protein
LKTVATLVLAVVLLLNVLVSVRILNSAVMSRLQKAAWVAFAWLVPFVGSVFGILLVSERSRPAPVRGFYRPPGFSADDAGGLHPDPSASSHIDDGGGGDGVGH